MVYEHFCIFPGFTEYLDIFQCEVFHAQNYGRS